MRRLYLSAAHKSSGKTTVAIGICAALAQRGTVVRPFKKGPDYIDPMWLAEAARNPCYNLDFNTMSKAAIRALVERHTGAGELAVVEGNKGLFDGVDLHGADSNAALARLLKAPVVLILDSRGTTRGIAPLLLGYQSFEPDTVIAGVIFNQTGGGRHVHKLRAAVEHYTDIPVLGAVRHDPALAIDERHLGLIPSSEAGDTRKRIDTLARVVASSVDLDRVVAMAGTERSTEPREPPQQATSGTSVRLGVIRDSAFGFLYADDLDALRRAGARLEFIDAMADSRLGDIDGLFIPGGFPETHLQRLQANTELRGRIRAFVEDDRPVYAECGGLMYLSRSIRWGDRQAQMVGAIPAEVVMQDTPVGRGYMRLEETGNSRWPGTTRRHEPFAAHEFHYSRLVNLDQGLRFAYRVLRGTGIDGRHDGIIYRKLQASYAHLRDVEGNRWASRFVNFISMDRSARTQTRDSAALTGVKL